MDMLMELSSLAGPFTEGVVRLVMDSRVVVRVSGNFCLALLGRGTRSSPFFFSFSDQIRSSLAAPFLFFSRVGAAPHSRQMADRTEPPVLSRVPK